MGRIASLLPALREAFPALDLRENEAMSAHCSFRIGGELAAMAFPTSLKELTALLRFLREKEISPFLFGNGTDLLVSDSPLDLLAVNTSANLTGMTLGEDGTSLLVECGATLARIAVFARENGLTGFEFAHGIPGTLGGAVFMNAGAYGGEMRDVVEETEFLDKNGEVRVLRGAEQDFAYRHSAFEENGGIVLRCRLRLAPGDREQIAARMSELQEKRRASQPLELPSAGSTFKRPKTGYAAALIDEAGLKGYTVGGAQVSEKHAGFVVNKGGATFADVLAVMAHIQKTVEEKSGVMLEPEVRILR